MDAQSTSPRRTWRFSLATLMVLMACVAGYLSGYRIGHKEGWAEWNAIPLVTKIYAVSDLTETSSDSVEPHHPTADELVELITSEVIPVSWMEAGGNGEIQAAVVSEKEMLIVSANQIVHSKLSEFLDALREDLSP